MFFLLISRLLVRPINKSGDKQYVGNYQYGFLEARSSELTSNIYEALDNSDVSLCISVDLAKASYTVSDKNS